MQIINPADIQLFNLEFNRSPMKFLALTLFISIAYLSVAQENTDSTDLRIKMLSEKYNNNSISKDETAELRNLIFSIQNKGFMFDEEKHDFQSALIQTDKALKIWISIKDTLSEANLRKYKGYLLGHLKSFTEAELETKKAIALFKKKNFEPGVAVSQHDLSMVFDFENKTDSALYYENISNFYWTSVSDTFRIMVSNNQLIHLYRKLKEFEIAAKIQNQSELLSKSPELHWNPLINFYYVSYLLYNEMKLKNKASNYLRLFLDKIEILKNEGTIAKSIYENQ